MIISVWLIACGVNKADSDFRPLIFAVKLSVWVQPVLIAVGIGKLVKRKGEPTVLVCINNRFIYYCLLRCIRCFCKPIVKHRLRAIIRLACHKFISNCSIALSGTGISSVPAKSAVLVKNKSLGNA